MTPLSRRGLLLAGLSAIALPALPLRAAQPAIHVLKDPDCGCCGDWIKLIAAAGFAVTTELRAAPDLARFKLERGIPEALMSCHTARIEGYLLEGHVPAADIRRLLAERPKALGLAVPGMPWGAPGMGPENEREAYDVVLMQRGGGTSLFSHYPAA